MQAAWYERRGAASEVLVVGEMPDPRPGPGDVRIKVEVSALNPGDIKKRAVWGGSAMAFPRVVPHSDGAGVVDAVGAGVPESRIGTRVWCYGAQSYRAFGTAAEYVVVPAETAVPLPSTPSATAAGAREGRGLAEQAACLGIAGITGHRAVFADGPVSGLTVLVHGATGGVGSIATQMARRDNATVVAVVHGNQLDRARDLGATYAVDSDEEDLVRAIREVAPRGVDRIVDVDFGAHIEINAQVVGTGATISSVATSLDHPSIPYWALGFADTCLRLLGSDDFTPRVKTLAATELTEALGEGALHSHVALRLPLSDIARAHDAVEAGAGGRVLIEVD